MKSIVKPIVFLGLLTILDLILRKGFFPFFIPIPIPQNYIVLLFFILFAILSLFITKRFSEKAHINLKTLGISLDVKNRLEFYIGFVIGIGLWALVSMIQSYSADFSWVLRSDISLFNIIYGLVFIFIADLGTELFTRGYALSQFKNKLGEVNAIMIMVLFVGLKSFSFQVQGELLLYTILIPALHTVFFSLIYFKTKRIGASLGLHTGANFVTICIFDLREVQTGQAIPSGIFQSNVELGNLSLNALQWPWIIMAILLSLGIYFWRRKSKALTSTTHIN